MVKGLKAKLNDIIGNLVLEIPFVLSMCWMQVLPADEEMFNLPLEVFVVGFAFAICMPIMIPLAIISFILGKINI